METLFVTDAELIRRTGEDRALGYPRLIFISASLVEIRLQTQPPGVCRQPLAVAVSWGQLREDSAPPNGNFDSTTAEVCVTLKHGLGVDRTGCEARSPRHAGPRLLQPLGVRHQPRAISVRRRSQLITTDAPPSFGQSYPTLGCDRHAPTLPTRDIARSVDPIKSSR